jgi:hypothetical protein
MRQHALARHAWWAGRAARSCSEQCAGWRCARPARTACALRPDPGGRAARSADAACACGARHARAGQQPRALCARALRQGRVPAEAVAWRASAWSAGSRRVPAALRAPRPCIQAGRVRADQRRARGLLQAGTGPAARCRRGGGGCTSRWAAGRARPRCPGQRGRPHAAPQFSHGFNREWGPTALREVGCLSLPEESARPYKVGADTSVRLLRRAEYVGSQVPRL